MKNKALCQQFRHWQVLVASISVLLMEPPAWMSWGLAKVILFVWCLKHLSLRSCHRLCQPQPH